MNIDKNPRGLLVSAAVLYLLTLGGVFWGLRAIHPKVPQPNPITLSQDESGRWWLQSSKPLPEAWAVGETSVVKAFRDGLPVYYWVKVTGEKNTRRGYPLRVLPKSAELPADQLEGFLYFREPMEQSLGEYVME